MGIFTPDYDKIAKRKVSSYCYYSSINHFTEEERKLIHINGFQGSMG